MFGATKMKIKKRITIVVDALVDEDFDCNELVLCHERNYGCISDTAPEVFEVRGEDWEVIDYVDYQEIELDESEE